MTGLKHIELIEEDEQHKSHYYYNDINKAKMAIMIMTIKITLPMLINYDDNIDDDDDDDNHNNNNNTLYIVGKCQ